MTATLPTVTKKNYKNTLQTRLSTLNSQKDKNRECSWHSLWGLYPVASAPFSLERITNTQAQVMMKSNNLFRRGVPFGGVLNLLTSIAVGLYLACPLHDLDLD
jgi:hypothetical protein